MKEMTPVDKPPGSEKMNSTSIARKESVSSSCESTAGKEFLEVQQRS